MKKILLCCFIIFFVTSLPACAQTKAPAEKPGEPQTKLEAFMAKKGKIVVKDSYDVDVVGGNMGHVELNALIVYEPGLENVRTKGLRIEVTSAGRTEIKRVSFLDMDEVEAAIKGLEYMMKLAAQWKDQSREPYTEIIFSTKGFFRVGFYHSLIKQNVFVQSGYISETTAFLGTDALVKLKSAFEKGLQILKSK